MREMWKWLRVLIEIAAIALVIWGVYSVIRTTGHAEPDVVYPMTNQRIEWTGAGYSGIWGR